METNILANGSSVLQCNTGVSEKTGKAYKFYQVVVSLPNGSDFYHILSDREYNRYLENELKYALNELQTR